MTPKTDFKFKLIIPIIIFSAFFALAGSAGAATYYVDSVNGNDAYTGTAGARVGTSNTGPWKNISKVNSFIFQTSDDVYLKCGSAWKNQEINVKWNGTLTDAAVIGAYYTDSAGSHLGISGARPIIEGTLIESDPCNGFPAQWDGLVRAENYDYVTMRDLHIKNSRHHGLETYKCDGCKTINNYIENTGVMGISFSYANENSPADTIGGLGLSLIENNTAYYHNRLAFLTCQNGQVVSGDRGAGIVAFNCKNVTMRGNRIGYTKGGEGYGIYGVSRSQWGNCTVENNVMVDSGIGVYYAANANKNIFRNNIALHSGNPAYCSGSPQLLNGRYWCGGGFEVANEESNGLLLNGTQMPHQSDDNYFYNNIVVGAGACFVIGSQWPDGMDTIKNIHFINNTCLGNKTELGFGEGGRDSVETGAGNIVIRNNIFSDVPAVAGITEDVNARGYFPSKNVTVGYNLWNEDPVIGCSAVWNCGGVKGVGDIYANPLLAKTSAWFVNGLLDEKNFSANDIKLTSVSPAINKGIALTYNRDHWNTLRPQGAGWDIGAHEYTTASAPVCGNAVVETGEQCDLGSAGNGVCPRTCSIACTINNCQSAQELVLHYTFDTADISGTTLADRSGKNNNGQLASIASAPGRINQAASLNGISSYIRTAANLDLSATSKITLSFWMNPNSPISGTPMIAELSDNYNNYTDSFSAFLRATGELDGSLRGNTGYSVWRTSAMSPANVWRHVAIIYDKSLASGEAAVYINGVRSGSIVSSYDFNNTGNFGSKILHIGSRAGTSLFYSGLIDDLRLYNYALTAAEITALAGQGGESIAPASPSGLMVR